MLDVHAPHSSIHRWRDFFIHMATVSIGLLIALGLEAAAEWVHHRNQVAETRSALQRELQQDRGRFAANTGYFRNESAMLQNNLIVLRYLKLHPGAPPAQLPGILLWESNNARMEDSAWKTACQTGITAFMPQEEVMQASQLYAFFDRIDRAHEEEADALIDAIGSASDDPDPTHWSPTEISDQLTRTQRILSRHLRHGFLMQNLAEQYPDFNPAPQREELARLAHLSSLDNQPEFAAARQLTHQRMQAAAQPAAPPAN